MKTNSYQTKKRKVTTLWRTYFALLFVFMLSLTVKAQVATTYFFSQSNGTYTPITGGTVIATATNHTTSADVSLDQGNYAGTIPFNFSFNGNTYTSFNANANGYITFGATLPTTSGTTAISATTAYAGAVAAMSRDLWGVYGSVGTRTLGSPTITGVTDFTGIAVGKPIRGTGVATGATISAFNVGAGTITMSANATSTSSTYIGWPNGEIRVETIGSAPNRICVIQYSGMADFSTTAPTGISLSWQIQLAEGGGIPSNQTISIVYGPQTNLSTTSRTQQVGLRGATNTDFNNRTSTTDWSATTAGTLNSSTVTRTNVIFPASGLTFTWTPPNVCTGTPTAGTAASSSSSVCSGNFAVINLTGYTSGTTGITFQWKESATAGGPYTNVAGGSGATTPNYTTANLNANNYYVCEVTCSGSGLSATSNEVGFTVNNPQLISTTPGSRCGTGTVTLGATPNSATVNWYTTPTGGVPVFSGTSFTTPIISSTTNYYAAASTGGLSTNTGLANAITTTSSGSGTTNFGLVFDVLSAFTLNTVKIYPVSASSASGTVTIDVINGAGTIVHTATVSVTGSPSGSVVPQTVTLNFNLVPGTNYKLRPGSFTGITGLLFEPSAGAPSGNYGYPFVVPGVLSINTSTLTAAPTNTARNDLYYYFYNWSISSGCESSPRTLVTATVNTAPAITASTTQALVCSGGSTTLNVTSSNPDYIYTWTPGNLIGPSVNVSPATTTTYTVTAQDNSGGAFNGCQEISTVTITAQPAAATVSANPDAICSASGSTTLSLNPASGYPAGTVQWQDSPDGITYTNISGATNNSYTTPVISASTYYKAVIVDGNSNVCLQPFKRVIVGIPTLDSSTPGSRCGYGPVNLSATASDGSTVNWYTAPTGGLPVFTGLAFTTPNINTTTTYYAAATSGGSTFNTSKLAPEAASTGTALTTYGQDFTVTTGFTLNSVRVYSTTGTSITISLYSAGGTTQLLTTGAVAVTAGSSPTISLGWAIAPGTYRICTNGMTGNFIRDNTGVTYPFALSGIGTMNGFVSAITGAVTTSSSYYFMYNWSVSTGCESARQPVVATVTPAPTITLNATTTAICPGGSSDLSVSSPNDPDYTYTWTSVPAGFTATGPGPHTVTPSVTTKYYVLATDNTAGPNANCAMIDSVTVINGGTLVAGSISAANSNICVSGATVLTLTGASGGANQWQSSTVSASGPWTNVGTGANTYNTGTITQTTYYQVETSCNSTSVFSNVITVTVNNPSILSTAPASRCGYGPVTLGVTLNGASTANWYTTASGGTSIFSGTSYTTPNINATTNYYVAASDGGSLNTLGLPNRVGSTTNSGYSDVGLMFDAINTFTLQSVAIYPVATTPSGNVTVTIALKNSAGTILNSVTVSVPTSTTPGIKTVVPLNFVVPVGTQHRLVFTSATGGGISGFIRELTTGFTYPYTLAGVASITSAYTSGASASYYYYFYDWQISTGCEGPRTLVAATVNASPQMTIASTYPAVCTGGSTDLSVTSPNDPNYTYVWTSSPAGFNQTGSGPFTVSPTVTTTYYVLATDNSGGANQGCANYDSITVVAGGTLAAGTLSANVAQQCVSGESILTLAGSSGGAIQWQRSFVSASGPWTNVQLNGTTYSTGVLTQTAYYQAEVSCQTSSLISNVQTITVSNPQMSSTSGATRCGPGQVSLTATPVSGSVNWYGQPTGGSILFTGTNYSPTVTGTTTYYAAPSDGGGGLSTLGLPNNVGTTTNSGYSDIGLMFDAVNDFTLQSVAIYPVATTPSGDVTVTIALKNNAGTILNSVTVSVPTSVNPGIKTVVPLNFLVPAGSQHRLVFTSATGGGITGFIREATTGYTYPYTLAGVASITSAYTSGASSSYYYYFYDWQILTGCEGARVPVVATVTTPPAINATISSTTICQGESINLNVTSPNDPNYTYVWNGTLNGAAQTLSPSSNTTYTVVATDNTAGPNAGCANTATLSVQVNPAPVIDATPAVSNVCGGGTQQLNVSNLGASTFTVTGTAPTTSSGAQSPFYRTFEGFRNQYIIRASELVTLGVLPGFINSMRVNVATVTGTNGTFNNFNVKAGTTTTNDLSAGYISGVPVRFSAPTYTPVLGTNTFSFGSPLFWNGTDNLVIEVCFDNDPNNTCSAGSPTCWGTYCTVNVATAPFTGSTRAYAADNSAISNRNICDTTGLGSATAVRPVMTFTTLNNLTYQWSPATGLDNPTSATPIATVVGGSNVMYYVTATNTITGCTAVDSVQINSLNLPQPKVTPGDQVLCFPDQIYLHVIDTVNYAGGYPLGTSVDWVGIITGLSPNDSIGSNNGSSYQAIVTLPNGCSATSTPVTILTRAVAVVDVISNAACGNANGSIIATITSGIPQYNFKWSTDLAQTNIVRNVIKSVNKDTLDNLPAGTYYLSVVDTAGSPVSCSSGVLTYTITSSGAISASASVVQGISCNGVNDGSVTVTATGGSGTLSYLWSNAQTTQTISGLLAGNYSVIVSDGSGCADTADVTLVDPALLGMTFTTTPETSAGASDGTVTAIVTGGTSPYTFIWLDSLGINMVGNGNNPETGLPAALYYGVVTDNNGCQYADTFRIELNAVTNATVNITAFIEGYYNGAGGLVPALLNSGVGASATECDTIYVELRDQISPTTVLASGTAVLSTSGQASFTFPGSVIGQNGYIAVFHRNAVQTWSDIITFSATTNYDFTTAATQAYNGNQREVAPGVWAFYSGDLSPQDEFIDILDQGVIDNDIFNFAGGYVVSDLSGDGFVDIVDQSIVDNNIFNFIGSSHP